MPHSGRNRAETPPPKRKYMPLESERPKTQEELWEEEVAHKALAAMSSRGCALLCDSMWASPQYHARMAAATKPKRITGGANAFFRNASNSGIKVATSPAPSPTPVPNAAVLATPPTTPTSTFTLNAKAADWFSGRSQTLAVGTARVATESPSAVSTYVPPHLWGIVAKSSPTSVPEPEPSQTASYVPPHLQKSASPPAQVLPPHLRGAPTQSVIMQNQAIHQNVPPHLRGITSNKTCPSDQTAPTATPSPNTTISSEVTGTAMASAFYPPARRMVPEKDDFVTWLERKSSAKVVQTAEKTFQKVTEKTPQTIIIKSEETSLPVRSPQFSPSNLSAGSKLSEASLQQIQRNVDNIDPFLNYMETRPVSKKYGDWKPPRNAFDNPRWKLSDDNVDKFEAYIKSGPPPSMAPLTAQNNTVYGSASVRAANVKAAQVIAAKPQTHHQKPTFVGVQKLGQNIMQNPENGRAQSSEPIKPAQAAMKAEIAGYISNNTAPKQPVPNSNAIQTQETEWQVVPSMKSVAAMISADVKNIQPESSANSPPLTQDALVLQTGFKTVNQNKVSDDGISSTGLGDASSDYVHDPRNIQGIDTTDQLADWDGTWAPAPVNWETERTLFDPAFIPEYIREWQKTIPANGSFIVDISSDKFTIPRESRPYSYTYPIANTIFVDKIDQGLDTIPDTAENTPDQELKRKWQTAEIEANNYSVAVEKKQKSDKRALKASNMRFREIADQEPEKNPFSPAIDIYMRPAEEKDGADIAAIYNWYISNTYIPEDQVSIDVEDAKWLIKQAKDDIMPFIVAVKGRQPASVDAQGRPSPSNKIIMPVVESVIGFCFPERFNYGFTSSWKGRSRATATLQLYVHHEHTRKGVGRNLLDRLIHCLTPGYAYKNAASWINPSHDKVYETEGAGMFHQLLFQIPVESKHDPNIEWLTKFLFKFRFYENSFKESDRAHPKRLNSVVRSSTKGRTAHFLDLAIFHFEARQAGEFDPYI
ncbi:uncharacterized protein RCO7_09811 [Rhynchosporium graminicola]|uniref:N-acetyltransferase domain-containing protein n=1 Tax=Rhynchosporium graminicola TaxID=2792576 RepID=A0A1E1LES2_9HELO|nr:uncharacterized protein RCO7_09811 [Rhynchosporium commune]